MRNTKYDVKMWRFAYVTPSVYVEINNSGKDLEMCCFANVEMCDFT